MNVMDVTGKRKEIVRFNHFVDCQIVIPQLRVLYCKDCLIWTIILAKFISKAMYYMLKKVDRTSS